MGNNSKNLALQEAYFKKEKALRDFTKAVNELVPVGTAAFHTFGNRQGSDKIRVGLINRQLSYSNGDLVLLNPATGKSNRMDLGLILGIEEEGFTPNPDERLIDLWFKIARADKI